MDVVSLKPSQGLPGILIADLSSILVIVAAAAFITGARGYRQAAISEQPVQAAASHAAAVPSVTADVIAVPTWTPGEPDSEMYYKQPVQPPKVSREEAIAIAGKHAFGLTYDSAPKITARYELMSHVNPEQWAGILEKKGLGTGRKFVDVPVWVVSYEGVAIYGSGPPPEPGDPEYALATSGAGVPLDTRPVNHEMNVVISADNGEVLGAFTYR